MSHLESLIEEMIGSIEEHLVPYIAETLRKKGYKNVDDDDIKELFMAQKGSIKEITREKISSKSHSSSSSKSNTSIVDRSGKRGGSSSSSTLTSGKGRGRDIGGSNVKTPRREERKPEEMEDLFGDSGDESKGSSSFGQQKKGESSSMSKKTSVQGFNKFIARDEGFGDEFGSTMF